MENFKIGDRVVVKAGSKFIIPVPTDAAGAIIVGEIIGSRTGHWLVEFAGWKGGHDGGDMPKTGGSRWFYREWEIEAAPQAKPVLIVVSDQGAATYPFKHPSRGAAESEAARLALKMPGVGFTVYQAVTYLKAPKPQVDVSFLDKAA